MMIKKFILISLMFVACNANLPTTNRLDRYGYVRGQVYQYAQKLNLQVDTQIYSTLGQQFTFDGWISNAAGVACPQEKAPFIVAFSQKCIEDENICSIDYLDKLAAHEVCHIYYNEQFSPCFHNEVRATECGNRLVSGFLP